MADAAQAVTIAQRAVELKLVALALPVSLGPLMHPDRPVLQWMLSLTGAPPDGDIPITLPSQGECVLSFSMREVMTKITQVRGETLSHDLLSTGMILGAVRLGDLIVRGNYNRKDAPLLQFARHYRNACAHGDRWHFRPDEPKAVASVRGLTLTRNLNGTRATFATVSPRLHIEFLEDVHAYFLQVAAQQVVDETSASHAGQPFYDVRTALADRARAAGLGTGDWLDAPASALSNGTPYRLRLHPVSPSQMEQGPGS